MTQQHEVTIKWADRQDLYRMAMEQSASKARRFNHPARRKQYVEPTKTYKIILKMAAGEHGFSFSLEACKLLGISEVALRSELSRLVCKSLIIVEKDGSGRNSSYWITDEGRKVLKAVSK